MAINSYELLLTQKVETGEITFTMEDMKDRTAAQRKTLYKLGAYKDTMMSDNFVQIFGVKRLKKVIDLGLPMNLDILWKKFFGKSKENYENIIAPIEAEINGYTAKSLKRWENYAKGRDLFIKGLGSFDIDKAYKAHKSHYSYSKIVTPEEIIVSGYLGQPEYVVLDWLMKDRQAIFNWLIKSKFPVNRADELSDLDILDMWHNRLTLARCIKRLDDMTERNLRIDYMDKKAFDYPKELIEFCEQTDFCCPKNGIDLKKQARRFSNCSGNYVRSIQQKETYIIYSKDEMISFSGKSLRVLQHYGKRNSAIDPELKAAFKEKIGYFIRNGHLENIDKTEYKVTYDTVPNGHFKNTINVSKEMFNSLRTIIIQNDVYNGSPLCSNGFNKCIVKNNVEIELGYNHRKLVS